MVEPLSADDLTRPNIVYFDSQKSAVAKDEVKEEMKKQYRGCSSSESRDWHSHLVCDNGVFNGMRLCAVQKDGTADDVGLEWAMTLGGPMVPAQPAHRGSRGCPTKSSSRGGDSLTSGSMLSGAVCQKYEHLVAGWAGSRFRDIPRLALWDFCKAQGCWMMRLETQFHMQHQGLEGQQDG